jgi:hypothetical protein
MSLRSLSWKVGQVTGPVMVGTTMDFVSTEAGFVLAAGFIAVATVAFVVSVRRGDTGGSPMDDPSLGD